MFIYLFNDTIDVKFNQIEKGIKRVTKIKESQDNKYMLKREIFVICFLVITKKMITKSQITRPQV